MISAPLRLYIFTDRDLHPAAADTFVGIVEQGRLERFITAAEVEHAFSGYAVYRRWDMGPS